MTILENIKNIPFEILSVLSQDKEFKQLLVCDENNFDQSTEVAITENDLLNTYITMMPSIENGIIKMNRNSFAIIQIDDLSFSNWENNLQCSGSIIIGTDKEHSIILKNKKYTLRLLEMIDRVHSILNGYKFVAAGKMEIQYASSLTFSEYSFGYRIKFVISDQQNQEKVEI